MLRTLRLLVATLVCVSVLRVSAIAGGTAVLAKATPTPPPQIIRIVTTRLCAALHEKVRPAVSMILQNDVTIAKSLPLFNDYAIGAFGSIERAFSGADPPAMNDSINVDSPATRMALQKMSYLVSPIAQNLLAAQTALDDPVLQKTTSDPNADRQLATIRKQLLETVAYQSASLDLINGFVQTQQMGQLQHAGETYLSAITGTDLSKPLRTLATPGPLQDPNAPGVPQAPYTFDPLAVPGLVVGYNPLSRLVGGVKWVQAQTQEKENAAAASLMSALASCSRAPSPFPSP